MSFLTDPKTVEVIDNQIVISKRPLEDHEIEIDFNEICNILIFRLEDVNNIYYNQENLEEYIHKIFKTNYIGPKNLCNNCGVESRFHIVFNNGIKDKNPKRLKKSISKKPVKQNSIKVVNYNTCNLVIKQVKDIINDLLEKNKFGDFKFDEFIFNFVTLIEIKNSCYYNKKNIMNEIRIITNVCQNNNLIEGPRNLCVECQRDLGRQNPRQLCGKTRCDYVDFDIIK